MYLDLILQGMFLGTIKKKKCHLGKVPEAHSSVVKTNVIAQYQHQQAYFCGKPSFSTCMKSSATSGGFSRTVLKEQQLLNPEVSQALHSDRLELRSSPSKSFMKVTEVGELTDMQVGTDTYWYSRASSVRSDVRSVGTDSLVSSQVTCNKILLNAMFPLSGCHRFVLVT